MEARFRIENPIRIMRFPFRVTDRKALKGCLPFTWKTHSVWIKSRRAWNWYKNKKDVNGTKFTGWNVPIGKRGQPFQTNRSFRESSGWAVEICLSHLHSVWNHRNFHVNGKQPKIPKIIFMLLCMCNKDGTEVNAASPNLTSWRDYEKIISICESKHNYNGNMEGTRS
jgi:hypothetical protein